MRLPISYSMRNLTRRPWRTAMTIASVAVVVFAAVLMLAMSRGLVERLTSTGEAHNLLAISRKGQNNMFSSIEEDEMVPFRSVPGLATDASGSALVSPELMHVPFVDVPDGEHVVRAPVSVRGVTAKAYGVHRSVKLTGGRPPESSFEILAGCTAHQKLGVSREALSLGRTVRFENRNWVVVGTFAAGGSLFESEIWANETDLFTVLRRRSHSFVVARFESPAAVAAATKLFETAGAMERYFKGWPEMDYYREFMDGLAWVRWLAAFMVVAIVIAGALIGINTMYSAVVNRLAEIGTQRVLGFSSFDIASSLLIEGASMALAGGLVGVAAGLLVNNVPVVFSQGAFFLVVDEVVAAWGLGLALLIGVLGSVLPAAKGLRLTVVEALRHG